MQLTIKNSSSIHTVYTLLFILLIALSALAFILARKIRKLNSKKKSNQVFEENEHEKIGHINKIAHELLTPLSLIISPLEEMINSNSDSLQGMKETFFMIHRNAKYLQRQIGQIIDISQYKSREVSLAFSDTHISAMIRDVALNFKELARRNGSEIILELPADEITASIDAEKIEAVLYNLVSNFLKNSLPGQLIGISLKIEEIFDHLNEFKKYLLFSITNHPGINYDSLGEKKFIDVNEIEGFDLSYPKFLIEKHNGFIKLGLATDVSFKIDFYLPYSSILVITPDVIVSGSNTSKEINTLIHEHEKYWVGNERFKVVLVEDNYDLRNFLGIILSRDYECYTFENGKKALEMILEIIPEIIIADVIMPEMNGLELCKVVKEEKATCHIPVILLTAKINEKQIVQGYEYGADAYITKPFNTEVLLSQVKRLIQNRKLIREKYLSRNFMVEISDSMPSKDEEFMLSLKKILDENIADTEFNVKKLSSQMNMSETQLYRKIKNITGYSPVEIMRIFRLQKSCELLKNRNNTVKEVCFQVGFNNLSYFVKCFREYFGVTPAVFRDQGFN